MIRLFLISAIAVIFFTGCGVRQFNGAIAPPPPKSTSVFGPFYSSAKGSGSMNTPECCKTPPCNHPCLRMRASVGMPYQFDVNSNATQGVIANGTHFPDPAGPYTTKAGAGKTKVASGPRSPEFPRLENKDLKMMKQQTVEGDHPF